MRHAAELADKAWKESESYAEILGSLEGKRIEAKSISTNIDNLKQHLVELEESDEWLESTLEQFESRQSELRQRDEKQKEKYIELKQQIEDDRRQLGLKQSECGKHENDKAQFERQMERRENMIKETARRNNIRGFDDSLDDMQVEDFMHRIRKLSKDRNQALERAKRETQTELREAQGLLNELGQRKSALQESKTAAKRQISQNDNEVVNYQNRLNEIDMDEGKKATLESRIDDVEQRLHQRKEHAHSASWDKEIQSNNAELQSFEEEASKLNAELIQGTKKAGDLARLDHLKKELKDREHSLETMNGAHGDRISKLVNQDWQPSTLEHEYQGVMDEKSTAVTHAERDRDGVARELEHVEYKLKNARSDLKQRRQELQQCIEIIREKTDDEPSEYPEIVKHLQTQLDMANKNADEHAGMGEYLEQCLYTAKQDNACRTCARPFKKRDMEEKRELDEKREFIKRIERLIKQATEKSHDENIQQLEEDLESAREASKYYDTWVRLSETEIPALEKEEQQLNSQKDGLITRIESYDTVLSERVEVKRDIESLAKTVATISKYNGEIKALQEQIRELSAKQRESGGSRSLEDIQNEIASTGEKSRALKKTISKLSDERDRSRTEINTLELELRDAKSTLDNARYQLERKAELLARIEEYRSLNSKQRETIDKANKDIEDLVPELSKAQAKYDDISYRGEVKERELQQEATHLSESLHQLDLANDDIKAYNDRGGSNQLKRSRQELKNIEDQIGQLESEQGEITKEINSISTQIQDSENTKRQYSDNLRYRQQNKALETVMVEIEKLEAHNAEVDRSRFREESERRTREHNALAAKQASKMGEMKSKDDQLMQLLADWDTDYKNAASNFKEAHIKVETTKAAVDDLGRYGGALDKAIMKYHSLKMEEINRIIEELWQKTYRGTDVDTILIRSDNENAKGNRSYNYRVCMVKQDAEMDMRGRCSAGQKVLASIIIRLALAECFGVNCGLIALDEPTTNLDRDNIRSLAESLHDIIKARQQQANFQLIVITHDEEFLRYMQCGDFCDYYYRVSRNERQKSIIERQSISEVRTGFGLFIYIVWRKANECIGYVTSFS